MVEPLRHRQTKGAATDMFYLTPPRHISTLPFSDLSAQTCEVRFSPMSRHRRARPSFPKSANRRRRVSATDLVDSAVNGPVRRCFLLQNMTARRRSPGSASCGGSFESFCKLRLLDRNADHAGSHHAERTCRANRHIDNPAPNEWSAIIDAALY